MSLAQSLRSCPTVHSLDVWIQVAERRQCHVIVIRVVLVMAIEEGRQCHVVPNRVVAAGKL
jgi:hypothetical protein